MLYLVQPILTLFPFVAHLYIHIVAQSRPSLARIIVWEIAVWDIVVETALSTVPMKRSFSMHRQSKSRRHGWARIAVISGGLTILLAAAFPGAGSDEPASN